MTEARDNMHIIIRTNTPTNFCYEPFLTQWRMQEKDGKEICYIQISRNESKPHWVRYGLILESYMHYRLEDEKFIKYITMRYPVRLPF